MVLVREYVVDLANGFSVPFADYSAYRKLLRAHDDRLVAAQDELEAGKKESCWLWWVLPTGRKGMNDPLQTYLTRVTARELLMRFPDDLGRETRFPTWRGVLEFLSYLLTEPGMHRHLCLTDADILRVRDFVEFWRPINSKPHWFEEVLRRLAEWLQLLD